MPSIYITSKVSPQHRQCSLGGGRETEVFQGKLEGNYPRSMDPPGDIRLSSGIFQATTPRGSSLCTSDTSTAEGSAEHNEGGGTEFTGQTSDPPDPCRIAISRILQQHICCPQERRGVASGDKLKISQPVSGSPPFQNGKHSELERCYSPRGPSSKDRSKRRLPICSDGCSLLPLSPFPLDGGHIRVYEPPFRSSTSSTDIHEIAEASGRFSQESGSASNHLSGRHSADGIHSRPTEITHISHFTCPHSPGIYSQQSQVCTGTTTVTRLPGFPDQLEDHDHCPSGEQGAKDPKGVPSHAQSAEGYSSTTRSSNWVNDSMLTSYCSSSATLPGPSGSAIHGPATSQDRLRHTGIPIRGSKSGSQLVDQPLQISHVSSDSATDSIPDIADRRFNHRVGSLLPGNRPKNRRTVVRARSCSPHQLVGAESSISSGTVFRQTGELPHTTTHGQQSCHILHQPERRNSLAQTMPTSTGPVDVVRGSQHNFARGASTREIECHCGFRVQTHERQQRLATGHRDFLSSSTNSRSFLGGSIRVLPECSTGNFLQLEGRPPSSCNRCFCSGLVGSQTILFPSLCTHREMSTEGQKQQCSICSLDCTNLAGSNMVSTASEHVGQPSTDYTESTGSPKEPSGGKTPSDDSESSTPGCMANLRKSLSEEGVSEQSAALICSSWRGSTTKAYESAWRRWASWCAARKVDPFSTTLTNILDFLTEMYNEDKEHSTINSYRSAISTFHAKIDGVPAGQHPMVSRLMQGIFNTRPSKPRYTSVWDVEIVLDHIKNMPPSNELRLTELAGKLAMLMALTNADRASDLHLLDLNLKQVFSHGVRFQIAGLSKTRRSGPPREVTYFSFKECEAICPVATLEVYERRTADLRATDRDANPLFIACVKPHKPVTSSTISRWVRNLMQASGVDVSTFKSHSTRAASTSAATSLGVSVKDIMKTANWTSESTFKRFYLKPILSDFGNSVLSGKYFGY